MIWEEKLFSQTETSPEDIEGMVVSQAIVTSQVAKPLMRPLSLEEWEPAVSLAVENQ